MNILWIPHNAHAPGRYQRDEYIASQLCGRHQIFILSWSSFLPHTLSHLMNPRTYLRAFRYEETKEEAYTVVKSGRLPRIPFITSILRRLGIAMNGPFLRYVIRRLDKAYGIDVIVLANSGADFGIPQLRGIPLIYDCVDAFTSTDKNVEVALMTAAEEVICVSGELASRAQKYNSRTTVIQNGADLHRFKKADGALVRQRLGLTDCKVVSLIGLTSSPSNYFLEAVMTAKKVEPTLKCLLVGHSEKIQEAIRRLDPHAETFVWVGPVPYEEVADYFAASDVGLYPGDLSDFFRFASPIKVFEYLAAGVPVVTSSVDQLERMDSPQLLCREATAESFAEGIIQSLRQNRTRGVSKLPQKADWDALAKEFEQVLCRVVSGCSLPAKK